MRRLILNILILCSTACFADSGTMGVQVVGEDTIYLGFLPEINIFAPLKFKNKRQEQFYWRTVRDVKKCLPYAKRIAKDIQYADAELAKLNPKEQKKWWKNYEKQLFRTYEDDFRHMTASQGRMLMKLLDRETSQTSYELIVMYKGKFTANFWQLVAKIFKNDLKEEYDASDKDKIIERVIILVEQGTL